MRMRLTPAPPDRLPYIALRPFGVQAGCYAIGAARGGHLAEKVVLCNLVQFKSAAGEPYR